MKYIPRGYNRIPPTRLFGTGRSAWAGEHLRALRIVPVDDVRLDKIYPGKFIPDLDRNSNFAQVAREIMAPTSQQLRQWTWEQGKFAGNRFSATFDELAEAIVTETLTLPPASVLRPQSVWSSSSSEEDKPELCSRNALGALVRALCKVIEPVRGSRYRLGSVTNDHHLRVEIGPDGKDPIIAKTDGGVALVGRDLITNSDRPSPIPVIGYEAKRRHAGGSRRASGAEERFHQKLLAQETAELLGQAMSQQKCCKRPLDQEAYLLTIHGTQARLIGAYFERDYLALVRAGRMTPDKHVWVRRSRVFDLKFPQERKQAVQAILGLLPYLVDGKAAMNLIGFASGLIPRGEWVSTE